jgi:hypothetical protein
MRRIVAARPRLESGRASRFTRTTLYSTALDVMNLAAAARDESSNVDRFSSTATSAAKPPRKRRRRRRRRPELDPAPSR